MPAGCDFICRNEECECYGTGFAITDAWPMGNICLVIQAGAVEKNPGLKQALKEAKKEGKKKACLVFPNDDEIPVEAYRVQYWSPDANCIWEYDVEATDREELQINMITADIPSRCPKTNGDMKSFQEVIQEGINCPHCHERLDQDRWFTNEE